MTGSSETGTSDATDKVEKQRDSVATSSNAAQVNDDDQESGKSVKNQKAVSGIRLSPFTIALIACLLLIGLGFFVLQQLKAVENKQHQLEISLLKNKNDLSRQIDDSVNRLRQQQSELESQNQDLKQAVIELRKIAGRERQGWILAETEHLLLIANHKLKLEGDVKTAMQAMLDADSRLERLGDPQLLTVRKQIAQELSRLQALKLPDINGISLRLNALSLRIAELGLNSAKPGQLREKKRQEHRQIAQITSEDKSWNAALKNIWLELKSTVVVHRRDKPIVPMLLPEQEKALRQVLEFKLESARVALLKRQQVQFNNALKLALAWLEAHFDVGDAAVIKFKQSLTELTALQLQPKLPDISASLHEVRYHLNKNSGKRVLPKTNNTLVQPEANEKNTDPKTTESNPTL